MSKATIILVFGVLQLVLVEKAHAVYRSEGARITPHFGVAF